MPKVRNFQKKAVSVPFWKIMSGKQFYSKGILFLKMTARDAMRADGKRVSFRDADLVKV